MLRRFVVGLLTDGGDGDAGSFVVNASWRGEQGSSLPRLSEDGRGEDGNSCCSDVSCTCPKGSGKDNLCVPSGMNLIFFSFFTFQYRLNIDREGEGGAAAAAALDTEPADDVEETDSSDVVFTSAGRGAEGKSSGLEAPL